MRDTTSREGSDVEVQAEHEQIELTSLDPRVDDARDEQQHRYKLPLGVELTGYHLLNIAVILGFGISKAVLSYHGQSVIPTTQELVGGTLFAAISYYFGMFKDKRPEIWPLFFRVDWTPPILEFLLRSEVYLCLLSFLPLREGVASLQVTLDARRSAQLEGHVSGSSNTVRIVLVQAIGVIILYGLATLWQLTKVLHFGALHRLSAAHHVALMILFGVTFTIHVPPLVFVFINEADEAFTDGLPAVPAQDIGGYQFDVIIATAHSFLILNPFPESDGFTRTDEWPPLITGIYGVFFLLRFVATFPIPWRSFIAGMSKVFETVYGAVRSAGSRV